MKKTFLILMTFLGFYNSILSQTYLGFEYNPNIPVKVGSTTLQNPWQEESITDNFQPSTIILTDWTIWSSSTEVGMNLF